MDTQHPDIVGAVAALREAGLQYRALPGKQTGWVTLSWTLNSQEQFDVVKEAERSLRHKSISFDKGFKCGDSSIVKYGHRDWFLDWSVKAPA